MTDDEAIIREALEAVRGMFLEILTRQSEIESRLSHIEAAIDKAIDDARQGEPGDEWKHGYLEDDDDG